MFIKWKSYLLITDIWTPDSYVSRLLKNKRLKKRMTSRWHCKVSIRHSDPLRAFFAFGNEAVEKSITSAPQRVRGTTSYWSQWVCEVSFYRCIKNNRDRKAHHVWKTGGQKWTNFLGLRDVCRDVIELTPQPCLQKGFHNWFSERGTVVITAKPSCGGSGYEVLVTPPLLLCLFFVLLFGLKSPNVL